MSNSHCRVSRSIVTYCMFLLKKGLRPACSFDSSLFDNSQPELRRIQPASKEQATILEHISRELFHVLDTHVWCSSTCFANSASAQFYTHSEGALGM